MKVRTKNKEGKCTHCEKEFKQMSYEDKKFCSRVCHHEYMRDKRPKHSCATCLCEIQVTKYRETRNGEYYCSKDCYNKRRKDNLKRLKRGTEYYKGMIDKSQCECGVKENYLLQIHHMDGNHNNNEPDNLEIVCANCHVKRHLKKDKNGNLVYSPKHLTKDINQ